MGGKKKENKKRKSGLEISFPVSAYQHETSASAVAALSDSEHGHGEAAAHTCSPELPCRDLLPASEVGEAAG